MYSIDKYEDYEDMNFIWRYDDYEDMKIIWRYEDFNFSVISCEQEMPT